jgi:hypothetical protein
LTADSEPGKNNEDGTDPTVAMAKGGQGTSDNEEEDTDDVATVDDIDEGGDKKPTAKTLTADSKPWNNNEDGANNDGDLNNKNDNDDENENEDDNRNEENKSENEDEDEDEDENEDGNENPPTTKNNPINSPHGTTPPPDSSTIDPIGEVASKTLLSQPGPPANPGIPRLANRPMQEASPPSSPKKKQHKSLRFIIIRSFAIIHPNLNWLISLPRICRSH